MIFYPLPWCCLLSSLPMEFCVKDSTQSVAHTGNYFLWNHISRDNEMNIMPNALIVSMPTNKSNPKFSMYYQNIYQNSLSVTHSGSTCISLPLIITSTTLLSHVMQSVLLILMQEKSKSISMTFCPTWKVSTVSFTNLYICSLILHTISWVIPQQMS